MPVTDTGLIWITTESVYSAFASDVPVIVTIPVCKVVTTPFSSTVAVSSSEDSHATFLLE